MLLKTLLSYRLLFAQDQSHLVTGKIWDIPFQWSYGTVSVWDQGVHTIPSKWYGVVINTPLGMVSDSQIPYHGMVFDRTPISHTIPYLFDHYIKNIDEICLR